MALTVVMAVFFAATADASKYRMLLCAGNNGSNSFETSTNTKWSGNPDGIFSLHNYCGPAPDPAGDNAFLRLEERFSQGVAGHTAYGRATWSAPSWVSIVAAGAYTRMPGIFRDGWRARLWAEDWGGGSHNILMQGKGVPHGGHGGIGAGTTSTFAPHLWPFSGHGDYRRFSFEMRCYRSSGCERGGWNAVDANTIVLTLRDKRDPEIGFGSTSVLDGDWSRGERPVSWLESDQGSGLRRAQLRVDGADLRDAVVDHGCDADANSTRGEFARKFSPCSHGPFRRYYGLNTEHLPDGVHELSICAQDFGQHQGLDGTGGETCDVATIRTDNTAPGKPAALRVVSENPARYLPDIGAEFSSSPDPGSPIAKVHYEVRDAAGKVVVAKKTKTGENPTRIEGIEGPAEPGDYILRVWLEDSVGHVGPAATAPVPRDTTPPAAPQDLRVAAASLERRVERFGLRWRNLADRGSPIVEARYRLLDGDGKVVSGASASRGTAIHAIDGIHTPPAPDDYTAQVWLVDGEGNVGAKAEVPLPRDTNPPAAPQDLRVAAASLERRVERFGLRWRLVEDPGSPVVAARYRLLDGEGKVVARTRTVRGTAIHAIEDIKTPPAPDDYTAQVWLVDGEGNVGAKAEVPLPRDTTPPAAPQHVSVASPDVSRAGEGFDLRWRNLGDEGSPIVAAHYQVRDSSGEVAVATRTVRGEGIEAIERIVPPRPSGTYTLRLWLVDGEGNVGAPTAVPLAYSCPRAAARGGVALTAAIGRGARKRILVRQGRGAALHGRLRAADGSGVRGAVLCVFSRVITDAARRFVGVAMTGPGGGYRFAVRRGPTRDLAVSYRPGHRRIASGARIATKVRPTFGAVRQVVRNKTYARFFGRIPGPRNDRVVVVLQVKRGNGWLAFRRYRTRGGGKFRVGYRFSRTDRPTLYVMRAEVRSQSGYPYVEGASRPLRMIVLPARRGR